MSMRLQEQLDGRERESQLQASLQQSAAKAEGVTASADAVERKLRSEIQRLLEELAKSEAACRTLAEERDLVAHAQAEKSLRLAGEKQALEARLLAAEESLCTAKARLEQVDGELSESKKELRETQARLESVSEREGAALALVEAAKQSVEEKEARVSSLRAELAEQKALVARLTSELQELGRVAAANDAALKSVRDELSASASAGAQAREAASSAAARSSRLEEQLALLQQHGSAAVQALEEKLSASVAQVNALERRVAEHDESALASQEKLRQAQGRLDDAQKTAESLRAIGEEQSQSLAVASERLLAAEARCRTLASELHAARTELSQIEDLRRKEAAEAQKQRAQLESELLGARSEAQTARAVSDAQVAENRDILAQRALEIDALRDAAESQRATASQAVRDASELRSRIAEALSRAEAQTTLAQNAGAEVARLEILVKAHEENSKRLATDAATATDALQMRVAQLEQQFRESSAAAARAEAEAVQARADRDAAAAEKTVALDACALARERVSESEQARVELERATSEALAQSIQATQNADRRVAEAEREVQSARARFAHAEKQLLDAAIVERERFEREAADLASRVAELETQLSDAVGAADGAQRREDEAKQKLADKIADQVELQTLLHSAQQMQRDLEQRNASLLAEITALRAQISQGEAASKTVNERRVEYEAETAKAAALSARVRQLEELLATAHARVADLEAAASARSSAQVSAKDARVESAVAMGGAAVLVEHSEVQIRNVPRPRKATAAADRSALSTFSGDDVQAVAQTEGEQWRQRLAALELELARRGADVREARLAVDGLGLELDASREEAHALRVSRAIAEEQRALAVRERDADRAELSRLAEASERLCAQLADAERDQRERVTAIEKEMLGARQRVAELEVEVDRLRNHATELAEKLSAAQDQLLQQRGDAERVAQQLRAEGAQLSILSSERSEESSVLRSRLDQVCEQATSDARRAAAEVADLQRAAKAAEEALAARTFELASAQAVCIELQSEGQLERSRRMGAEEELRSTRLDRIQGPSMLAMEDSVGVERERQRDAANVRSALARELGEHEEVKRHEREKYMQEALAELQQSNSLLREDVRRAQTELESASEAARFVQERCADQEARAADLARQLGDALASAERLERERDDLLDRIRALESAALERSNSPRTPSEREERVGEASVLLSASHEVEGAPNIREGDPAPPLAPPPSVAPAATSSLSEQLREAEASDANEHALESREIELLRALSAAERRGAELEADIAAARTKNEQLEAQLASAASQVLAESWKPHHKRQLSPLVSPRPQSPSDAGPSPRAFLSDTHRPVLQGLFGFQGRSRRAEGVLLDNAMALRARIRARRDALVEGGGKAANGSARGEEEEAEEANRASTDADAEESKKRSKSPVRLGATAQALGSVDSMSSARVQRHPTSPRLQHQHSSSNVSAQGLRLVEASAVRARPLGSAGQQQELHAAAAASLHAAAQPGAALGETGAGAFAAGETDAAAHQAAEQGGAVSTAVCQRAARAERRDGKGKRERGAKRRPRQGEGAPRRNGEEEGGGAAEGDEQQQEGAGERRVSATRRYGVAGAAAAVGTGLALAAFALLGTAPASSPAPALASASLMDAAWEALGASKGL
jgi:chromosome segregation ATPase